MASAWQRKWSRLTQMRWEEIRTRVGQEISKRLDLTLYRVGLGPQAPRLRPQPDTHARFFFGKDKDEDKNEAARRTVLLRTHLPQEADQIVLEADALCRHQFHLLGYEKLDYGPNIDWHSDAAHGKRSSPLKPWFKIDFLNFREVGDHKVIWELNRHQHLVTFAKAWLLTGNQAYTSELTSQWYSWQKANPYPLGVNWASTLEVAFRSISWLWVRNLLVDCTELPDGFQTDLLLALQLHGRYIERYLSTYFSPNTHYLGEAVALFFIGTLCPEIPAAERWRDQGWSIVLKESERQVRPDGVYFEQALYYHVYALDFFLHARQLASENGFTIPEQFDSVLKRMLDVVQALSAVGPPEGFGDDDGGRVFNPRRNAVECMTDPLALGAILYGRERYAAAGLTEEAIWLFGDKAIQTFATSHASPVVASRALEAGGIYLISDHEPCLQQLMIDAGPQGTGHSGHGHADALSIRLSLNGHRFLIDPGTCRYISDGEERNWFRGTGAHNTLRVDNLDQAVPEGPFAWSSIPQIGAETWLNGKTFDFFVGSHNGYCRLHDRVLHRRFLFHVKGGLWLVRDEAEGQGRHLLEIFWHFAPELEVREERGFLFAEASSADQRQERDCLALLIDRTSRWTVEIAEGFVSRAYGSKQIAPVVSASASTTLPADCGTLLLPTIRASDIGTFTAIGENPASGVRGYRYQTPQSSEFAFFAQQNTPWTCGPWASDATFLYCKLEHRRFAHVIMVSGSFAEWRGQRFVSRPSPIESFEWLNVAGSRKAFSSEGDMPEDTVISDFELFDSAP
ncbi:MAG: alginate lyase family protein [Candidatus Sulfotelmatobacter sp.]